MHEINYGLKRMSLNREGAALRVRKWLLPMSVEVLRTGQCVARASGLDEGGFLLQMHGGVDRARFDKKALPASPWRRRGLGSPPKLRRLQEAATLGMWKAREKPVAAACGIPCTIVLIDQHDNWLVALKF
jgi:hypothetical protein